MLEWQAQSAVRAARWRSRARTSMMTAEERSEMARMGAKARWASQAYREPEIPTGDHLPSQEVTSAENAATTSSKQ